MASGRIKGVAVAAAVGDDAGSFQIGYAAGSDPIERDTRFDIGSVSKALTGVMLASLVTDGVVELYRPLGDLLPNVSVPKTGGREITLEDLATHTSGLPSIPPMLAFRVAVHPRDPYRGIEPNALVRALRFSRARPLNAGRYSNFGFALLALAMQRTAGRSYAELLDEAICARLGLVRTTTGRPSADGATGHRRLKPVPDWDVGAFLGAGGIWSTADDVLIFARAHLPSLDHPMSEALSLAQAPRRPMRAGHSIGLGWMISRSEPTVVWHTGGSGGFGAYTAFCPAKRAAIAILYNSRFTHELSSVGLSWLRGA